MVCRSVCLSVTFVRRAKTAEPIEMPFALWTLVGPRNHILDGGPYPLSEGAILKGERGGPLCTDQDAIWSVDSGGPEEVCVIWGAYWHYLANTTGPSMCGIRLGYPCVAAMRPLCQILGLFWSFMLINWLCLSSDH